MTHRVVVVGSGFGGLFAVKALARDDVEITLIDRTSHHLFQPLLYQVATGILSEGEIAPATREILRRQRNVRVVQGLVESVDVTRKVVHWRFHDEEHETIYDSLILATGSSQSYFGHDEYATFAPGMKSIDDALELRSRIFGAFELAEIQDDPATAEQMLTFVVVGAGPTGVEMAGQIRELANRTLAHDFRRIDPSSARVVLVDAASQVLPPFGPELGAKTHRALEKLGVEVVLDTMVTDVDDAGLTLKHKDGTEQHIASICKVWAAGVQGNALGKTVAAQTGAEVDRSGRVKVLPDLTLPGHPEVYVIGDLMSVEGVPGMAQGAIQSARYAASAIHARVENRSMPGPFTYHDKGSMATIAKFQAVCHIGKIKLTGFIAWLAWLLLHLLMITGFKQKLSTLLRWIISFFSNGRAERVTTNQQLVGRLAIRQLGRKASAALMRGETVSPPEGRKAAS
ncbi:MAG TPA: NAD(P)/FAD-dependent oxidoreductase [Propionibacteriaceae bacterium]|nr:NAD(P)/FAD-dependent oxidoreductase [Propionibacteriaceae bacterium]